MGSLVESQNLQLPKFGTKTAATTAELAKNALAGMAIFVNKLVPQVLMA
jgi:hypothetical protein